MMRNRGSDRKGMFLSRNEARHSQMVKTGKCSRLIHEQKDRIEAALSHCQMTISELAFELGLSNDTIRNRINEMVIEGRGVRVAGWHVLDTTMVRIWGIGFERMNRNRSGAGCLLSVNAAGKTVRIIGLWHRRSARHRSGSRP